MLENDFNLIYSDDVIQALCTHDGIMHQSLMIQFKFAPSLCRQCFAKQ